jgi:hypothetical protein
MCHLFTDDYNVFLKVYTQRQTLFVDGKFRAKPHLAALPTDPDRLDAIELHLHRCCATLRKPCPVERTLLTFHAVRAPFG